MKSYAFLIGGFIAMLGVAPVAAAQDTETVVIRSDSYYAPTARASANTNRNMNYEKYESRTTTRSYNTARGADANYYYPTQRGSYVRPQQTSSRSQMYRNYDYSATEPRVTTRRAETTTKQMKRKYYLAHPFFQPTEGNFGSITDLSWNNYSYDLGFSFRNDFEWEAATLPESAKWSMDQIAIKEDFSYGITDRVSLMLMGRYDISNYKFEWPNADDDKSDDSGLNIYGVGAQWRFADNEKWIATLGGFYERQKDVANEFILDLRGGYKISRSTIYGVGRGWLVDFDESTYGNYVEDSDGSWMFVAYDTDVEKEFFVEAGLGVFSVLNEDITLNLEALFGNYGWHNQGSIKAAVGWQPGDSFALNLYARMAFYDSMEGQSKHVYGTYENKVDHKYYADYLGNAKIDNYSEYSIGAQLIFLF